MLETLLDANDPRPAQEQLAEKGWRRRRDCKLDPPTMNLNPDIGPPTLPIETYVFREDKIYLYEGGGVLIMLPWGGWLYGEWK